MAHETSHVAPIHVVVAARQEIATGIHRFDLKRADGGDLAPFTPGAHIEVRTPNGLKRKYSLCDDPSRLDRYVIAVKRESDGRGGSASMTDALHVGDLIEIGEPRNDFALKGHPVSTIFIAGGIGITPIRSMIMLLMATQGRPFKLYYFTRTPGEMAFREEFMTPAFRAKVVLHHDDGDPARAFDLWPVLEIPKGAHVYCCGPRGLMQAVRDMTGHWSSHAVHFEDFGSAKPGAEVNAAFTVKLAKSGRTIAVPPETTLLEALRGAGIEVASSCESGTCGTCKQRLLSGDVDHRDLVLSDAERASAIMVCVSRGRGGEVEIDL